MSDNMVIIFAMASERSGTKYLAELFKYNIKKCVSKHEPFFFDMFGKPIYWYQQNEIQKIRRLFKLKKLIIDSYHADVYVEMSHAFLKSFAEVAMEFYPNMKLIHVLRNPLESAKSQFNRPVWIGEPEQQSYRSPLYTYRDKNKKMYLKWTLTGNEQIFKDTQGPVNRYQTLLLQWVELENRAMNLLQKYNKYQDCYTLRMPHDFNDERKIRDMMSSFNLTLKDQNIFMNVERNTAKTPTVITDEEYRHLDDLIARIPKKYLDIFRNPPYTECDWAKLLVKP
jgi:hypothetical protein